MILNLLYITLTVVFVIDISGIIDSLKALLKWLFPKWKITRIKPFDCSLCMTWWCTLLYVILSRHFTLYGIMCCAAASFLSPFIAALMQLVQELFMQLINLIYNLIENKK